MKDTEALKFLGSPRGQYIVGQALAIAVKQLETVEEPYRETSNIEDMKLLGENLFKAGYMTQMHLTKETLEKLSKLGSPTDIIEDKELIEEINNQLKDIDGKKD